LGSETTGADTAPAPPKRGAAFFDLDKTIIAKSSTLAFGRPLYKAGILSRRTLLKAGIAQIIYVMVGADHDQMEKVREQMQALTKGWDATKIRDLVRETVDEVVAPLVFAEALAMIDEHHRANRRVVIISSSPDEVVRPLAVYLGVDDVIATRSLVGPDGRYTGELEFYAYGPGKAEAIREMAMRDGLSLPDSYAYSDSITDLPMLETVGHPVAVNPDKELEEVAGQRDWQIMDFERPVTLRTRLATLPKPVPVISGAAIAGLVGTAVIWLAVRRNRSN
jgi:HAD superfamily hydrolase (TIGR01490 family)